MLVNAITAVVAHLVNGNCRRYIRFSWQNPLISKLTPTHYIDLHYPVLGINKHPIKSIFNFLR